MSRLITLSGRWLCHKSAAGFLDQSLFHRYRWRPYHVECTGSLLTSEVKQRRARSVLGWGTAWEDLRVLSAFLPSFVWHHNEQQVRGLQTASRRDVEVSIQVVRLQTLQLVSASFGSTTVLAQDHCYSDNLSEPLQILGSHKAVKMLT